MKVILLQDVARLGRRYSIVEVPDGYGINKLIPKGLAKPATPENVKAVQARANTAEHSKEVANEQFHRATKALLAGEVRLKVDANAEGRFFQALKAESVAVALTAVAGMPVTAEQVVIAEPIKAVGEHTVTFTLGSNQQLVTITVEAA